ncbi:MAG: YwaF family protein [Eubacteriales bacterium]|nr:YwaF family protein [Eubacteriales bacterium]
MFELCHFIWIAISALAAFLSIFYYKKAKPPLEKVLSAACGLSIVSEVVKTLTMLQAVPSADGSVVYLYLDLANLPLQLCSIQILLIFIVRFTRSAKLRENLLAFMYPTCLLGALLAIALPSFLNDMTPLQRLTSPRVYQYFLYHIMLLSMGIYIAMSGCVRFRIRHLFSSLGTLCILGFSSLYINSMFAAPVYQSGQLVSIEYMPNFFFTQALPVHFPLAEKWQWLVWLCVELLLAFVLFSLCFLPLILREKRRR